ncbi:hypothetical protein Aperf_G00000043121 [Anoplocephala perfoliata]
MDLSFIARNQASIPTTCVLYPCEAVKSPHHQLTKKVKPSDGFNYSAFFEEQIEKKRTTSTYRVFRRILRDADHYPFAEDFSTGKHQIINVWCSNDYLGMSRHPMVCESASHIELVDEFPAAQRRPCRRSNYGKSATPNTDGFSSKGGYTDLIPQAGRGELTHSCGEMRVLSQTASLRKAVERFGVGSGGTRNISGNTLLHEALEHELADLHNKEAGLLFTSCSVANEAVLYTLGTLLPSLKFFSDAGNHASIIHGIRTSRAPKFIYPENEVSKLDELMTKESSFGAPKLAACETVHSMNGSIVPLKEFLDICEKHGALSFVDEVHAVGLYGERGAGIGEERGCMHRIDAITGTLGKAFASIGGYLVGDKTLVDMIRSYAGGLIFTTSLPPPVLAAARTSVAILKSREGQQLREEHRRRVSVVRRRLQEVGLPVPDVGNPEVCSSISEKLLREHHIYLQSINYPTVAKGTERLRLAPSPFHTDEMTDHLVDSLVKVWLSHKLTLRQ